MDPYATRVRKELRDIDESLHRVNSFIFHYEEIVKNKEDNWKRAIPHLRQLGIVKAHLQDEREKLLNQVF